MTKLNKISIAIISVLLVVAVIFGFATKNSYKDTVEPEKYVLFHNGKEDAMEYIDEFIVKKMTTASLEKQLKKCNGVFLVTVEGNERIGRGTKTTAKVDKVIRGKKDELNKEIIIYEPNYMCYIKRTNSYIYGSPNYINNIMQVGKQYLVFAKMKKYAESYQNTLDKYEYVVPESYLYSFPLEANFEPLDPKKDLTYADIKDYDYICFTEEQKEILDNVLEEMLEKYL